MAITMQTIAIKQTVKNKHSIYNSSIFADECIILNNYCFNGCKHLELLTWKGLFSRGF